MCLTIIYFYHKYLVGIKNQPLEVGMFEDGADEETDPIMCFSAVVMRQSRMHINTKRYQSANVSRSSKATKSGCAGSLRPSTAVGQASDSSVATVPGENSNMAAAVVTSPASPRTTSNTAGRTPSFPPYNRISRCTVIGAGELSASAVVIFRYTSYMVVIVFRLLAQRPTADGSLPSVSTAAITINVLIILYFIA